MPPSEVESNIGSAKTELWDAIKAVPSGVVLGVLWFILLRYTFDRWQLVASLPPDDRVSLAFILAVPLALITYFFGNYWDDRVFDPRYTEDPHRGFRGKWLDTSRRNCFGLLPAGRDLDKARQDAARVLKLPTVEGVYKKAKDKLEETRQWARAGQLLVLSKFCRSLIWPSFLVTSGFAAQAAYRLFTGRWVSAGPSALGALIAVGVGLFLFVPYINLRVEHMLEMYRRINRGSVAA